MRLNDPDISHGLYCYSQQGPLHLVDVYSGAAFQKGVLFGQPEEAAQMNKAAYFMALIMVMSHELEKGKSVSEVANGFFDKKTISDIDPLVADGSYDQGFPAQALSEKAKINAQMTATGNLGLLFSIAYASFDQNTFTKSEELKQGFARTIQDNRWPEDFIQNMDEVFAMDLSAVSNVEVNSLNAQSRQSFAQSENMVREQYGDYTVLDPSEYRSFS